MLSTFSFRMWDTTDFVYQPPFNDIVMGLASEELQNFFKEYVLDRPEEPHVRRFRPIFPFFESYVISLMTKNHRQIASSMRFLSLQDFLNSVADTLRDDRAFVFMTINRDSEGRRQRFPRTPLPGIPSLRFIFYFLTAETDMNLRLWAQTQLRFFLHFAPVIQEFASEDSGCESEG